MSPLLVKAACASSEAEALQILLDGGLPPDQAQNIVGVFAGRLKSDELDKEAAREFHARIEAYEAVKPSDSGSPSDPER